MAFEIAEKGQTLLDNWYEERECKAYDKGLTNAKVLRNGKIEIVFTKYTLYTIHYKNDDSLIFTKHKNCLLTVLLTGHFGLITTNTNKSDFLTTTVQETYTKPRPETVKVVGILPLFVYLAFYLQISLIIIVLTIINGIFIWHGLN